MFVYVITCHCFDGYGESYVWKVFDSEMKAINELQRVAAKYNMEYDEKASAIYNFNAPSAKNRFYKLVIQKFFVD